jgi:dipeptidase E
MRKRCIVAIGGGGLVPERPALEKYLLAQTGRRRPKVCFIPTAGADNDLAILRFMVAFEALGARPTFLRLFSRRIWDLRSYLLGQDLIYVGGGNTGNMLAIWKYQGVDKILREAWEEGVVLSGGSAGSLCWYDCGMTDVCNPIMEPIECLGLLPGSHCPHYHHKNWRYDYMKMVRHGLLPAGIALDDNVAARYEDTKRIEIVATAPRCHACLVERVGRKVREKRLPVKRI